MSRVTTPPELNENRRQRYRGRGGTGRPSSQQHYFSDTNRVESRQQTTSHAPSTQVMSNNDPRLAMSIAIQRDLQAVAPATGKLEPTPEERAEAEKLFENLEPFGIPLAEITDLVVRHGVHSPELEAHVNMIVNDCLDGAQTWHAPKGTKTATQQQNARGGAFGDRRTQARGGNYAGPSRGGGSGNYRGRATARGRGGRYNRGASRSWSTQAEATNRSTHRDRQSLDAPEMSVNPSPHDVQQSVSMEAKAIEEPVSYQTDVNVQPEKVEETQTVQPQAESLSSPEVAAAPQPAAKTWASLLKSNVTQPAVETVERGGDVADGWQTTTESVTQPAGNKSPTTPTLEERTGANESTYTATASPPTPALSALEAEPPKTQLASVQKAPSVETSGTANKVEATAARHSEHRSTTTEAMPETRSTTRIRPKSRSKQTPPTQVATDPSSREAPQTVAHKAPKVEVPAPPAPRASTSHLAAAQAPSKHRANEASRTQRTQQKVTEVTAPPEPKIVPEQMRVPVEAEHPVEPPTEAVMIPPSATAFHVKAERHGSAAALPVDGPCVVLPRFLASSVPHPSSHASFMFGSYRQKETEMTAAPESISRPATHTRVQPEKYHDTIPARAEDHTSAGVERQQGALRSQIPSQQQQRTPGAASSIYSHYGYPSAATGTVPEDGTTASPYPPPQYAYRPHYAYMTQASSASTQPNSQAQPVNYSTTNFTPQQTDSGEVSQPQRSNRPEFSAVPWGIFQSMDYSTAYGPAYAMGVYSQPYVMNGHPMNTSNNPAESAPEVFREAAPNLLGGPSADDVSRSQRHATVAGGYVAAPARPSNRLSDSYRVTDRTFPPPGLGGVEQMSLRNPMGPFGSGHSNPNSNMPGPEDTSYRQGPMYSTHHPQQAPTGVFMPYAPHHYQATTTSDDVDLLGRHQSQMGTRSYMAQSLQAPISQQTQQRYPGHGTDIHRLSWNASPPEATGTEEFASSNPPADETTGRVTSTPYEFLRPQNPISRVDYDTRNKADALMPSATSAMGGPQQYSNRYSGYPYLSGWPSPRAVGANYFQSNEGVRR